MSKKTVNWSKNTPLYLDYQATTPMDPRVLEKMLPFFSDQFGNPHSRTHQIGWDAESAVENAPPGQDTCWGDARGASLCDSRAITCNGHGTCQKARPREGVSRHGMNEASGAGALAGAHA